MSRVGLGNVFLLQRFMVGLMRGPIRTAYKCFMHLATATCLFAMVGCIGGSSSSSESNKSQPTELNPAPSPLAFGEPILERSHYLVGEVPETQIRFPYRNTSQESVEFLGHRASCTCASVEFDKKRIAPGSSGDIVAKVDLTMRREGELGIAIDVSYADGNNEHVHRAHAVVRLRRELMAEPVTLRMPAFSDESSLSVGRLTLRQYAAPGEGFSPVDPSHLTGPLSISRETKWQERESEGCLAVREKELILELSREMAQSVTPATAILRTSARSGHWSSDIEVRIYWDNPAHLWLEPASAVLNARRRQATFRLEGSAEGSQVTSVELPDHLSWRLLTDSAVGPSIQVTAVPGQRVEGRASVDELVVSVDNAGTIRHARARILTIADSQEVGTTTETR